MPEPTPSQFDQQDIESSEHQKNLEAFCERIKLQEQYDSQVKILTESGIFEILSESQSYGIVDINGHEYSLPVYEEVLADITPEKLQILELKESQGFTKLLLVPFGALFSLLAERYKTLLWKINQAKIEGKGPGLLSTANEPLDLDVNDPFYQWEKFKDNPDLLPATNPNAIFYYPTNFDSTDPAIHQGKTKQQLLAENKKNTLKMLMVENLPDLPAEGKGKTLPENEKSPNRRKQLEANQTSKQYLHKLQTEPQYQHEQGMTLESELIYAITQLIEKNQVIDDYGGQGKACYLIGSFLAGNVPGFYWYRGDRQAVLGRVSPGVSRSVLGVRSAVKV